MPSLLPFPMLIPHRSEAKGKFSEKDIDQAI
jgi:hypothetical protein